MKKTLTCGWRLMAALIMTLAAAGCSDGELNAPASFNIAPPPPMIITFAADPASVKAGGETTIKWEVAGADEIEITSVSAGAASDFHVVTSELSGSQAATNLQATTDFVLTAKKTAATTETEGDGTVAAQRFKAGQIPFGPEEEPDASGGAPLPSESVVSQTITVTVTSGEIATTITADKNPVAPCEETILRWTVSPAEGVTTVVSADTGEAIAAKDQCDGDIAAITAAPTVDPMPAVGCAVVKPCEDTLYTVTATDGSGGEGTSSVTVEVDDSDVTADIFAGKTESEKQEGFLSVSSFQSPVYISWKVEPAAAKVTVTSTPAVTATTEAPCELPTDATDKAEASTMCKLSAETKFTITATLGDKTDSSNVTVVLLPAGGAGLLIADQWALDGEKVQIPMKLDASTVAHADMVQNVLVNTQPISADLLTQLKAGTEIKVESIALAPSVPVKLVYTGGEQKYEPVKVVELVVTDLGADEMRVSSVALDSVSNARYRGVQLGDFNGGTARLYRNDSKVEFNFGTPIKNDFGMQEMWQDAFFDAVADYPVAVAVRDNKPTEVYAGVTGALMKGSVSADENGKESVGGWQMVLKSMVQQASFGDVGGYDGDPSHPTCGRNNDAGGQKVQPGLDENYEDGGAFISMNRICDVAAREDGRLFVATDWGVCVEQNIDTDPMLWLCKPQVGKTGPEVGMLTYGHVVNDILDLKPITGENKVFAAADHGVFMSPPTTPFMEGDDPAVVVGVRWEAFGSIDGTPVYALAYDSRNTKLYAATEDGIYSSPISTGNWNKVLGFSGPALSIAIDQSSPGATMMTIIVGTPEGVKISRDTGANFMPLSVKRYNVTTQLVEEVTKPVEYMALVSKETNSGKAAAYDIAIGTGAGSIYQHFTVNATSVPAGDAVTGDIKRVQDLMLQP